MIDGKQYLIAALENAGQTIDMLNQHIRSQHRANIEAWDRQEALEEEVYLLRQRLQVRGLIAPHRPEL